MDRWAPGELPPQPGGDREAETLTPPASPTEQGHPETLYLLWAVATQVGLGYLKRPELTQQRFVNGPRDLGPCFRTGDIARAASTGWELVGRRDGQVLQPSGPRESPRFITLASLRFSCAIIRACWQVKLNGQRVELGEIEEVLLSAARDPAVLRCDLLQVWPAASRSVRNCVRGAALSMRMLLPRLSESSLRGCLSMCQSTFAVKAAAVVVAKVKRPSGGAQQRPQLVAWCVPACPEEYGLARASTKAATEPNAEVRSTRSRNAMMVPLRLRMAELVRCTRAS